MTSFFKRLIPKFGQNAPEPAAPPQSAPASVAVTKPPVSPRPVSAVARRPLVSANGDVAGFEFRVDDAVQRSLGASGDVAAQTAQVAVVLVSARLVAMQGRIGFARLPAAWLAQAVVPKDDAGLVVGVEADTSQPLAPEAQQALRDTVAAFRTAGARLAWSSSLDMGVAPDFWLLRPSEAGVDALLEQLKTQTSTAPKIPAIVTDVDQVEHMEMVLQDGAQFASGAMRTAAPVAKPKAAVLAPEVGRLSQLLSQLSAGADTPVIVAAIKGDVSLTYRLLQRMNSASFAHLGGIASVDQAVQMLGRNELHRWLSLMLMKFAGSRKMASALQEVALCRSRLVELLAIERGEAEPGRFFTLGLASMLGLILKIAPEEVVTTLSLPPEAEQALLGQTGPWHVYLHTAAQVENQTVSDASVVADGFSSLERVLELSSQAWAWADANAVKDGPKPA
jgi:EAL and modified HD-GYP domain-containing signal transduction protein